MKLDVATLVLIVSLVFATQTVAMFAQFRVNKTYKGLGWWLMGTGMQALGYFLMLAVKYQSLLALSMFANPLVVLGEAFLYIGIKRFFDNRKRLWLAACLLALFIVLYFSFIFLDNSIFLRTVTVTGALAGVSFMIAVVIYREKMRKVSGSARFTSAIFFAYGLAQTVMVLATIASPQLEAYGDINQEPFRALAFVLPIIGSTLWAFGFIIMVNQRLNAENLEEKNKLQMVFNVSPDAKYITRMSDGLLVDVNTGFLSMIGFAREETIGTSILDIKVWNDLKDRESFIAELRDKGLVENREFYFRRKDGSTFIGSLSGRTIIIDGEPHIVSVIHDITERKAAEKRVRNLLEEKELILKEVHHRLKNNMSTMQSLLSLQAASLKDPMSIAALEDAGSRLESMMVLYDVLYKSNNFTNISIGRYLSPLIDEIIENFPNSSSVRVEHAIDDFTLEVKKLQVLGIIVNELITNIMKYAFSGDGDNLISVSATRAGSHVTVSIEDNGKGIPESVSFESSTGFGLRLVSALTSQLDGKIRIERGDGTRIVLEFEE